MSYKNQLIKQALHGKYGKKDLLLGRKTAATKNPTREKVFVNKKYPDANDDDHHLNVVNDLKDKSKIVVFENPTDDLSKLTEKINQLEAKVTEIGAQIIKLKVEQEELIECLNNLKTVINV